MSGRIIVLSGGVGGAKLVLGLSRAADAKNLTVVANTGDDFDHYRLRICPDIDTVLYTLGSVADKDRGWGREDESWQFMAAFRELGGEDWFNLGDRDLALHVLRTDLLSKGESLSEVTAKIACRLGIEAQVLPMSDQSVSTIVDTVDGRLAFQHYFVRERCLPEVTGFTFEGLDEARPNPALIQMLDDNPSAVIIAPSNPFVSIDPILSVPGLRDRLRNCGAPIVAVSPIVGGQAIKGPAAKIMNELGIGSSAIEIARHYAGFIDGLVIDNVDSEEKSDIEALGVKVKIAQTIMTSIEDRIALANCALDFACLIGKESTK